MNPTITTPAPRARASHRRHRLQGRTARTVLVWAATFAALAFLALGIPAIVSLPAPIALPVAAVLAAVLLVAAVFLPWGDR